MSTSTDNTLQLVYDIGENRYINLTDRCTLSCQFCPKFSKDSYEVHEYDLSLPVRPEIQQIKEQLGDPAHFPTFNQFVFCGFGEPTLRLKPLLAIAHYIKDNGGQVRVNTDGLGNKTNKRNILPELAACVDSLSISLNAQNETIYNQHCKPALKDSYTALLDFIKLAPNYIPDVTASAIDGLAGVDITACERIAKHSGVKFRRRVLDLVG